MATPDYTQLFWAKASPYRQKPPERIHLLEHHMADVGACFEQLMAQPTIRQRLASSGGLDGLDNVATSRLALFAALHDIGKVNVGFQTQVWRDADFPHGKRPPALQRAGHYLELAPVLTGVDSATAGWFFDELGWWKETTASWDSEGGETVCGLFIAALSHHGRPLQLEGGSPSNRQLWQRCGGLAPREGVQRIGMLVRDWFPTAWATGGQILPNAPAFQHYFLGLCTLADWIGSNEEWFPYCGEPRDSYIDQARTQANGAIRAVGLDIMEQRNLFSISPEFARLFPYTGGQPNAIQQATCEKQMESRLLIVESETGSGKTEAALWRFARMYEERLVDGIYFALPTRAAARQLYDRVTSFVEQLFPPTALPETVLAVPGYLQEENKASQLRPEAVYEDQGAGEPAEKSWASESAKRFLAAQIAVGTVDQAMLAALQVRHSHMRAACLARNLLVIDEVHASDPYMRRILKELLDVHLGAGGYALLMSATLGSVARQEWLTPGREDNVALSLDEAIQCPYPAISVKADGEHSIRAVGANHAEKSVRISASPLIGDFESVGRRAVQEARHGAKVLIVRNTVSAAVSTQQALERAVGDDLRLLFTCNDIPSPHHSRFAGSDRRLLDAELERRLGKERTDGGLIVVGTQTLEQSLDIDADFLITDLCPIDVLLQRIGRLHRHGHRDRPQGFQDPSCIVLTPNTENLTPLLHESGPGATGLGPHGRIYKDLRILEATRRLINQQPTWRIPQMNRELVERATHPEALEAIVDELGGEWRAHSLKIDGEELADGLTADSVIVRWNKAFYADNKEVLFGSSEEWIRTRLGDGAIEIEFEPQPYSPFNRSLIGSLVAPAHLLPHPLRDAYTDRPVEPVGVDGGFTFAVGNRAFRYDRLGLRRDV